MTGPHRPLRVSATPNWSSREIAAKKGNRDGITVLPHRDRPSRTAPAASWGRRSSRTTTADAARIGNSFFIHITGRVYEKTGQVMPVRLVLR